MKKIQILILSFFAIAFIFEGCKKDDHTNYSTLKHVDNSILTPSLALVSEPLSSFKLVDIPVSFKTAPISDVYIKVIIKSSTATLYDPDTEEGDFELVSDVIMVPAHKNNFSIPIKVYQDAIFEGDETITFELSEDSASNSSNLFNTESVLVDVKITNTATDQLSLTFDWGKDTIIGNDTISTCGLMDMDFIILDQDESTLPNSLQLAATSRCPETFKLISIADTAANGTGVFYLVAQLYENQLSTSGYDFSVPITLSVSRVGGPQTGLVFQSTIDAYRTTTLDYANDGNDNSFAFIKVVVNSSGFFIYNYDGDVLLANARKKHYNLGAIKFKK